MGDAKLVDSMMSDGLWDAYNDYHMGVTAENVAKQFGISRRRTGRIRGRLAAEGRSRSKRRALQGRNRARPDQVAQGRRSHFDTDEYIRAGTTLELLARAQARIQQGRDGHGGNASGINDGAAAVMMMSARKARELGLAPAGDGARLFVGGRGSENHGHGTGAGEPPVFAEGRLDSRRISISWRSTRRSPPRRSPSTGRWDGTPRKINVNGGAIAIGHPIGASGCRILVTLLHEMIAPRRQEGSREPVHRRRHGRRARGRALTRSTSAYFGSPTSAPPSGACSSISCLTTPGSASVEMSPS